jgi:hypothetical protein
LQIAQPPRSCRRSWGSRCSQQHTGDKNRNQQGIKDSQWRTYRRYCFLNCNPKKTNWSQKSSWKYYRLHCNRILMRWVFRWKCHCMMKSKEDTPCKLCRHSKLLHCSSLCCSPVPHGRARKWAKLRWLMFVAFLWFTNWYKNKPSIAYKTHKMVEPIKGRQIQRTFMANCIPK